MDGTLILEAVAVVTMIISLLIKIALAVGHGLLVRKYGRGQQSEESALSPVPPS